MADAASNVGAGNGTYILVLAIFSGWFSVILGGLIAGKSGADMAEPLKWGIICMLLSGVLGIGYIMACCIACKSKDQADPK
jgi:hypothetical protein